MYASARTESLVAKTFGDGMAIFDEAAHRLHELNSTATRVWRHCDGRTSMDGIARAIAADSDLPEDDEIVRLALTQLSNAGLLEDKPGIGAPLSRRQLIRRLGKVGDAAPLVPLVSTIVVGPAAGSQLAGPITPSVTTGRLAGPITPSVTTGRLAGPITPSVTTGRLRGPVTPA